MFVKEFDLLTAENKFHIFSVGEWQLMGLELKKNAIVRVFPLSVLGSATICCGKWSIGSSLDLNIFQINFSTNSNESKRKPCWVILQLGTLCSVKWRDFIFSKKKKCWVGDSESFKAFSKEMLGSEDPTVTDGWGRYGNREEQQIRPDSGLKDCRLWRDSGAQREDGMMCGGITRPNPNMNHRSLRAVEVSRHMESFVVVSANTTKRKSGKEAAAPRLAWAEWASSHLESKWFLFACNWRKLAEEIEWLLGLKLDANDVCRSVNLKP